MGNGTFFHGHFLVFGIKHHGEGEGLCPMYRDAYCISKRSSTIKDSFVG